MKKFFLIMIAFSMAGVLSSCDPKDDDEIRKSSDASAAGIK
ncbi:hypothetical protein [Pseudopedobacter beijingensis]|uniref:Lipoprotein n=1 Tax=Pseudopedobacter beijingensis TaxID=1207056 RepID=A0ABW4I8V5_9SPHI